MILTVNDFFPQRQLNTDEMAMYYRKDVWALWSKLKLFFIKTLFCLPCYPFLKYTFHFRVGFFFM